MIDNVSRIWGTGHIEGIISSSEQEKKWRLIYKFYNEFLENRFEFILRNNQERGVSASDEGFIASDFFKLANQIKIQDQRLEIKTSFAIVTGNPDLTLNVRLPESVRAFVNILETGDSGLHRGVLLKSCIDKWRYQNKVPNNQENQIFYFDDSVKGLRDASFFYGWSDNKRIEKFDPSIQLVYVNRNHPEYAAMGGGIFTCGTLGDPRLHTFLLRESPVQMESESHIRTLESNRRPSFKKIES